MKRSTFLEERSLRGITDLVVKADDVKMPEPRDAQLAAEFPAKRS